MTYLLDTHYLVWTLTDTAKLTKKIRDVITHSDNEIAVSTVSFWEVSLKASIGKLTLKGVGPEDLPGACTAMRFAILPLGPLESSSYHRLKGTYHKDPFDRMLIWQAICNDLVFISSDGHIRKYTSDGLRLLLP
jgi:PIN domain nuclease of toxin-antitoxin system